MKKDMGLLIGKTEYKKKNNLKCEMAVLGLLFFFNFHAANASKHHLRSDGYQLVISDTTCHLWINYEIWQSSTCLS